MKLVFVLYLSFALGGELILAIWPDYPKNEYEYSLERDKLLEAERLFQGKDLDLSQEEKVVSDYLQHLKWEEFEATKNDFAPFRPIEKVMGNITSSYLYSVLRKLPKGGNMHTHENHELSKSTLLDIVYASSDFEHLYMLPADHPDSPYMLDFFITPPETEPAWLNVKDEGILKEDILQYHTLFGILDDYAKSRPTDSAERWRQMGPLWDRASSLILNVNIKPLYLDAMLRQALDEGVSYLESRKNLGPAETIYELDASYTETYGKRPLGDAELEINITMQVIEQIQQEYQEFIGLRRIVYTTRYSTFDEVRDQMERVVDLHQKYPDHVMAFDLVGEEDYGNSHLFYLRNYLELYNEETKRSAVALKLHTAESNWPQDLITGFNDADPMATLMNTYESILLGANRIGHGLGFIKHPYMLNVIKERGVAIESCAVSNQILGFMADLRNHPAIHYMRQGIPVVLGSDDPGTFGYDNFTTDWYEAFMGWGLDLIDLRTLAINSLNYSSMSREEIDAAIVGKWEPKWMDFISEIRDEACAADFTQHEPFFGSILPREGQVDVLTRVHVFGRHFERGICKQIICDFGGNLASATLYVSNNHIICEAPVFEVEENEPFPVSVSFDGGNTFYPTGENYTYKSYDDGNVTGGGINIKSPEVPLFTILTYILVKICVS